MTFLHLLKSGYGDPKWFFRYGLWQYLNPRNLYRNWFVYLTQFMMRGFTDRATWSVDFTIAKFAHPLLKRFKECNNGLPRDETFESWNQKLDLMIEAMALCIRNGDGDFLEANEWKKMQEGCELFGKYFLHLWW